MVTQTPTPRQAEIEKNQDHLQKRKPGAYRKDTASGRGFGDPNFFGKPPSWCTFPALNPTTIQPE